MKKIILIATFIFISFSSFSQSFAYVDTDYILNYMPEYKSALKQLETASKQWQQQAEFNVESIDKMYKAYQADQVLLTDDVRKRRESEILEKETAAKEFQKNKFGPDGELFKMRVKLLKPIQEKVALAIAQVAKAKSKDFIFDKSSETNTIIYANSSYDLSNEVLLKIGYKPDILNKTTKELNK